MAGINPTQLFQLMGAWQKFTANHPKFPKFLKAVAAEGIQEHTIIEVSVTTPEGKTYCSNLKITQDDLDLLEQFKHIS
ncbi:MAG: hypothetical protein HFH50_06380 [Lachnospiraceae bacterium]|jgi:hypothetical protein|nr:hypothetical protein [Lachnospiraceae bacterium]MCI8873638.1 hypothetical protein [Lachnospiraceae bacterium]